MLLCVETALNGSHPVATALSGSSVVSNYKRHCQYFISSLFQYYEISQLCYNDIYTTPCISEECMPLLEARSMIFHIILRLRIMAIHRLLFSSD